MNYFYNNIFIANGHHSLPEQEIPVCIFSPLSVVGKASLKIVNGALLADIRSETNIEDFYIDYHTLNKKIVFLFLMEQDKRKTGKGKIKDQVDNHSRLSA